MKRWIWLLVFPYVVSVTKNPPCKPGEDPAYHCGQKEYSIDKFYFSVDKDFAYDTAEALNDAHVRRQEQREPPRMACTEDCGIIYCGSESFVDGKWYKYPVPESLLKEVMLRNGCPRK